MGEHREAWDRFSRADWEGARDVFAETLASDPKDPEALDGLGQSLWWLGERQIAIERRREAYAAYQRRGDRTRAAGIAVYLAGEHRIDGRDAEGSGWLARARRLLADAGDCAERGWLAIEEAKRASDPQEAERLARDALELSHRLADPDVECMALAQIGYALVRQGRTEDAVALLDEAMTIALAGEGNDPLACGDACCTTLLACERMADVGRTTEWCEAVVEFTERRRFVPMRSWCRGIYAGVLIRAGEWEHAEEVLQIALRDRAARRAGAFRELPVAMLADLRVRQGRMEEAAELVAGLEDGPVSIAPRMRLELELGNAGAARELLDRWGSQIDQAESLVWGGALAAAEGDGGEAITLAARLRELSVLRARPDLGAQADLLEGQGRAIRGDEEVAAEMLGRAASSFDDLGAPYEAARARLERARVVARRWPGHAVDLARAARDELDRLGARRAVDHAAALLRELGAAGRATTRGDVAELTPREREVLALIAAGLSNAEIAERLVIAPKTAEHHVGHVLAKLGVRTRAEAAARAVRDGL